MRQSNYNLFYTLTPGNPAILGAAPVDRWLCVPPWAVCLYRTAENAQKIRLFKHLSEKC